MAVLQLIDEDCIIARKKVVAQKFLTRYDSGSINQLEYRMEHKEAYIRTLPDEAVLIDAQDRDAVWLTVSVGRGRASTILTREQTQLLIAQLQRVIA
jgi:hypothetical protein